MNKYAIFEGSGCYKCFSILYPLRWIKYTSRVKWGTTQHLRSCDDYFAISACKKPRITCVCCKFSDIKQLLKLLLQVEPKTCHDLGPLYQVVFILLQGTWPLPLLPKHLRSFVHTRTWPNNPPLLNPSDPQQSPFIKCSNSQQQLNVLTIWCLTNTTQVGFIRWLNPQIWAVVELRYLPSALDRGIYNQIYHLQGQKVAYYHCIWIQGHCKHTCAQEGNT